MRDLTVKLPDYSAQSRFFSVWVMFVVAMAVFAITRTILMVYSLDNADLSLPAILRIFATGGIYDAAFYLYAVVPVSLYLLLVPNRMWSSRINRIVVHLVCFASVYGLLFIAVSEYIFWEEFEVRFNFISVDYLVYRREVTDNIFESYPVIPILSALLLLASLVYWKLALYIERSLQQHEPFRARMSTTAVLWSLAAVAAVSVGPTLMQQSENIYQNELSSNGPHQFFSAFRSNELDYYQFYATVSDADASDALKVEMQESGSGASGDGLFDIRRTITPDVSEEKRLNIMLVMIESLSAEYLGIFGDKDGLTPNLDELAHQSLLFKRFYATGNRTTRGLEAVTLSIPPTPGRSIVKRLDHATGMWSLGEVLRTKGYRTSFIYGGRGYFDNMNSFFSGNGYEVIDQSSTPSDEVGFVNAWGMSDEDLYTQTIKAADSAYQQGSPFFLHVMTTSNHRPYSYPENRIDIPSGSNREGAVKYTDWAIGDFLSRAREKPWFKDTVFVFVADHTAGSAGKTALPLERYHIPLLVYSPAHVSPGKVNKIASQIDLGPTLLAMLNMEYVSNFFGKNILDMGAGQGRALIANYQHLGLYTRGLLSISSPRGKLTQQLKPESDNPVVREVGADDPNMHRNLAYYQGASYIYSNHMNDWNSGIH
jgi:phosphoglycerol transferase MdoB-like AlkP superfamily enzyme